MTNETTMKRHNNSEALDAFIARKAEIDEPKVGASQMLARIQGLSDNHFNVHPDEIHWGHVGDLGGYAEHLREITNAAFQEGEHAE